jgi:hypothetical protein
VLNIGQLNDDLKNKFSNNESIRVGAIGASVIAFYGYYDNLNNKSNEKIGLYPTFHYKDKIQL